MFSNIGTLNRLSIGQHEPFQFPLHCGTKEAFILKLARRARFGDMGTLLGAKVMTNFFFKYFLAISLAP